MEEVGAGACVISRKAPCRPDRIGERTTGKTSAGDDDDDDDDDECAFVTLSALSTSMLLSGGPGDGGGGADRGGSADRGATSARAVVEVSSELLEDLVDAGNGFAPGDVCAEVEVFLAHVGVAARGDDEALELEADEPGDEVGAGELATLGVAVLVDGDDGVDDVGEGFEDGLSLFDGLALAKRPAIGAGDVDDPPEAPEDAGSVDGRVVDDDNGHVVGDIAVGGGCVVFLLGLGVGAEGIGVGRLEVEDVRHLNDPAGDGELELGEAALARFVLETRVDEPHVAPGSLGEERRRR
mmetsp:Transcript_8009/g.20784  ORF Transcript_8009/g.20784 Transcript_8009/m.20784 type:complete len:296 (-) Transcript_8009:880-1767(-)